MIKEILEQPASIKAALAQDDSKVREFAKELMAARNVMIVACGTARHAGLIGRFAISRLVPHKFLDAMIASEYSYFADTADKDTVILAISQSGETADVLECVRKAKAQGAKILSIVNVPGSTLARESKLTLYTNAGPEVAVASTKAFTAQAVLGILIAYAMAGKFEEGKKELSR